MGLAFVHSIVQAKPAVIIIGGNSMSNVENQQAQEPVPPSPQVENAPDAVVQEAASTTEETLGAQPAAAAPEQEAEQQESDQAKE